MSIEGRPPQPTEIRQAEEDQPTVGPAKPEGKAEMHDQQRVTDVGHAALEDMQHQPKNPNKTGLRSGGTPLQRALTNQVAAPILRHVPHPPEGPSPRRPDSIAPQIENMALARALKSPPPQPPTGLRTAREDLKQRKPPPKPPVQSAVKAESASAREPVASTGKREKLSTAGKRPPPSPPQGPGPSKQLLMEPIAGPEQQFRSKPPSPAEPNLTSRFADYQKTKNQEMAARNSERGQGADQRNQALQQKVDGIYAVAAQCIKENKPPVLENGVLKVGGEGKGKAAVEIEAYKHIGNILSEAFTSSFTKVWATNGQGFTTLWSELKKTAGDAASDEVFEKVNKSLNLTVQELRARGKVEKPSIPPGELFDNVLAGEPEAADMLIFSHRENNLTAKPFSAMLGKLQELGRTRETKVAFENALAFVSLYLDTGASIPVDPAKKLALKQEIQALVQYAADHPSAEVKSRVKEAQLAIANHLQPPSEGDVVWALKQARSSLRERNDLESALQVLTLARGRTEPAIIAARTTLEADLKTDNQRIHYNFHKTSAKQMAADLGTIIENNFRALRASELDLKACDDDNAKTTDAPAFTEAGALFNQISDYLKLHMLAAGSKTDVARAMAKVIEIGYEAMQNGNYELALCVDSALSHRAVSPLSKYLDASSQKKLNELQHLCDAGDTYKNYQEQLARDRLAGKPAIPILSVIKKAAIMFKEASGKSSEVNVDFMTKQADLKRQFAQDLGSLRQRPIPNGNPALGVVMMVQQPLSDETLDLLSRQIRQ
ncbi:MAG: RasGEF domain-containing protein [Parachlamydia sp.]|nr:RasGEF domain-containing protein [Parachlamydia sp.]